METAIGILIYGLATSGIYALMAIGVTLIFGIGRVINFAHGAFYTLGAYFAYFFAAHLGWPMSVSVPLAMLGVALLAIAFDRVFIDPVRARLIIVWIMTFAAAFAVRESIILIVGAQPLSLRPMVSGGISILGQTVGVQRVLVAIVSGLSLLLLFAFLYATRFGKGLRAVALNTQGAHLVGIPVRHANAIVMGISAALAALAGIMISPISVISPDMGLDALMMAFTIVVIGGIGSLRGTLLAALLVGYASTAVAFLISPKLVSFAALAVVAIVLVVKPTGLFGLALEDRA
jgi:branched-chain amino acid transport system permease protein